MLSWHWLSTDLRRLSTGENWAHVKAGTALSNDFNIPFIFTNLMLKTLNKTPQALEAYIFLNRQTIPNVFIISRWNPLYSHIKARSNSLLDAWESVVNGLEYEKQPTWKQSLSKKILLVSDRRWRFFSTTTTCQNPQFCCTAQKCPRLVIVCFFSIPKLCHRNKG